MSLLLVLGAAAGPFASPLARCAGHHCPPGGQLPLNASQSYLVHKKEIATPERLAKVMVSTALVLAPLSPVTLSSPVPENPRKLQAKVPSIRHTLFYAPGLPFPGCRWGGGIDILRACSAG